ncbi:Meiosis regulator and mRNA stability factor 1 [Araneus ventricosus]|uniref:Meiosis regulator and mRNA stability factor 1 n=1 Tax=Araneus ventricosus TaxID=182803 RepID=A0A4Y2FN58_ARAVE|nr:Meiosis regulator and mRNA stability factor 1 [Araneus ventricosus]
MFLHDHHEVEFTVVCDVLQEKQDVIDDLNEAQLKIVHILASAKNSIDEKLKMCMKNFVDTIASPATIVLLSSDINFAPLLSNFKNSKRIKIFIVHNKASEFLLEIADQHFAWSIFTEDLPPRKNQLPKVPVDVIVSSLPSDLSKNAIERTLLNLTENLGGKIAPWEGNRAILKFSGIQTAARARKRLDNQCVGHKIIKAKIWKETDTGSSSADESSEDDSTLREGDSSLGVPSVLEVSGGESTSGFVPPPIQQSGPAVIGTEEVNQGSSMSGISLPHEGDDSSNSEDDEPPRTKQKFQEDDTQVWSINCQQRKEPLFSRKIHSGARNCPSLASIEWGSLRRDRAHRVERFLLSIHSVIHHTPGPNDDG